MSELDLVRFCARLYLTMALSDISEHDRKHASLHSVALCEDDQTVSILVDAGSQTFPFSFTLPAPVDPATFDLAPICEAVREVLH